ncbi:unnamed protein product [Didymodactylos carnosus]|uniref:Uncharacterized protein n=1 Tax=Didymodactylos carnosus TaxID=1234261 RepID=A0A815JAK2_9BILA|nr:unnamed protein product [Didymodactylos carnosus]CAF1376820.1 unnamed protein product [Didymodactylos carnosus]CAF3757230.1 unnamed protein product [Didymodactylos carnosus]CAF4267615.1 unnamed protein product [Didymodactylos carnosus]
MHNPRGPGLTLLGRCISQALGSDISFTAMSEDQSAFEASKCIVADETKVFEIQIDRPATGMGAKIGKLTLTTTEMETVYDLGQKMIEALTKEKE